jgi:alkylation response protein AidB-like acyl-CoA dehydrogenase
MNFEEVLASFRRMLGQTILGETMLGETMPLPGGGQTALRHRRLMAVARESLSLARLAEAHWDAIAILAEAGREPEPGMVYGVWASGGTHKLLLAPEGNGFTMTGSKMFCSGAGLLDRTLLTVDVPEQQLVEVDLRRNANTMQFDESVWKTSAFIETRTAAVTFMATPVSAEDLIGSPGWYLERPGFWHGACGPAACWAGGAAGLVDYAMRQPRDDPHTLAHLGAMQASVWAVRSYLDSAGREIDKEPDDAMGARIRALRVRHLIEQACTDILRRLLRAYGPHPLAMDADVSRRYQELDLYLRQCHAERDLERLGRDLRRSLNR